jgi:hypothetical protein
MSAYPVSRKEMRQAKLTLNRLWKQIHDAEKAEVLRAAARVLAEELNRLREPRMLYTGRVESNGAGR